MAFRQWRLGKDDPEHSAGPVAWGEKIQLLRVKTPRRLPPYPTRCLMGSNCGAFYYIHPILLIE